MKSNMLQFLKNSFIVFIILVFVAGYNSDKIKEALLPKVNTIRSSAVDAIDVTVNFEGVVDVKHKIYARFSYPLNIVEWFVEDGEAIEAGDPLFRIDNLSDMEERSDEERRLILSLERLNHDYRSLTGGSFDYQKTKVQLEELNQKKALLESYKVLAESDLSYISKIETLELTIQSDAYAYAVAVENARQATNVSQMSAENLAVEILKVQNQLDILNEKEAFYSHINEDGICYASESGIITEKKDQRYFTKDQPVFVMNLMEEDQPLIYTGTFDASFDYLIQKNDMIYLDIDSSKPSVAATIIKVHEPIDGVGRVDAMIESESGLLLGQEVKGRSMQKPASTTNVPRTAIISKNAIRQGSRVEFYCVSYESGVLGNTATLVRSYGSVAYIGDDYIGLSDKTLPTSFTGIIVDNPQPTLKGGDRITE